MALYTETVTIVACSVEGGNFVQPGMPHPIVNGVSIDPSMAYVTIRSDDNSRRTFAVPLASAKLYVPGALLSLSIDVPAKAV